MCLYKNPGGRKGETLEGTESDCQAFLLQLLFWLSNKNQDDTPPHLPVSRSLIRIDCAGLHVEKELFNFLLLDFFVVILLFLLIKTSAYIDMGRWALEQVSSIFSGGWHLNKPLSFLTTTVSWVWLSLGQAAESGF